MQTIQGAELTQIQGTEGLYLIKLTQPEAELQLKGESSCDTFTRWATKLDAMQKKRETPN